MHLLFNPKYIVHNSTLVVFPPPCHHNQVTSLHCSKNDEVKKPRVRSGTGTSQPLSARKSSRCSVGSPAGGVDKALPTWLRVPVPAQGAQVPPWHWLTPWREWGSLGVPVALPGMGEGMGEPLRSHSAQDWSDIREGKEDRQSQKKVTQETRKGVLLWGEYAD